MGGKTKTKRKPETRDESPSIKKTRVLIVDDSHTTRSFLTQILSSDDEIEIVGSAPDAFVARDMIVDLNPDILTLDVEMPRMDGITFMKKLMKYHPMPVIIVSSNTPRGGEKAMNALDAGALDVILKPGEGERVTEVAQDLIGKIKSIAGVKVSYKSILSLDMDGVKPVNGRVRSDAIIAVGSSTGGTFALASILDRLPENSPGIIIVQHMPQQFTKSFAERLNSTSRLEVMEACDGDEVIPGRVLVAPGNYHMLLRKNGAGYCVEIKIGPRICKQRPSVDALFKSVARTAGPNAVGILLTGMGIDGAWGLKEMRERGAKTVAQNEESCIVFGMPKAAIELDGVDHTAHLSEIPQLIINLAAQLDSNRKG